MTEMDRVVAEHHFTEKHRFFSVQLVCACGYETDRFFKGLFLPAFIAFAKADHWAALLGIRKWRQLV